MPFSHSLFTHIWDVKQWAYSIKNAILILDTLPKPHIPSAVPLFTGREDEIKEITNLVTDESTRLLNIWGSPGFGKTSTAIQLAHHLLSLGYPVYFFKLHGISTVHEVLSKMLSIFKCNLTDVSLSPADKLVSTFREICRPIFLILDNLDDLVSSDTSSAELTHLFAQFLDSNININILLTTREFLENMCDQVKGFQNVRIRPLSPVSSNNLVRQHLPSFSEIVVARVARISSHVPLAIKLIASLVKDNSEEMTNKILKELQLPENRLEHLEKYMQPLFDTLFEQLTSTDKHALISLSIFSSATISKDAAINVVSGEMQVASNAIRSLKTFARKSLIDEDPSGKYYCIHPLINSFIVDKAKQANFRKALNSSKICFCRYYLLLFERLNDDFLAGKSVNSPQLEDVMYHLTNVMFQSIESDSQNAQHLLRILSKAEIILFLIDLSFDRSLILELYDFAIEKCKALNDDVLYLRLLVSSYFRNIAFSLFVKSEHFHVPKAGRQKINKLLDGTTAKLFCYEGIFSICNGDVKNGIQQIEMHLDGLQKSRDHLFLKCLCLQILILYYNNFNELDKSCKFKEMVIKVCAQIGNSNLFLIAECNFPFSESTRESVGEPLVLFSYLLTRWSEKFSSAETKRYICNLVYNLQQQQEVEECGSDYLYQILRYGDYLLVFLCMNGGQKTLLNEKMESLSKSIKELQDCGSLTDETFSKMFEKNESMIERWSARLQFYHNLKDILTNRYNLRVEDCRKALDFSLQQYGEQHKTTAECYFKVGLAENTNENYSAALNAFDQAINIMSAACREPDDFAFAAEVYFQQGYTYQLLGKFEFAIASYKTALDMTTETKIDQLSKTIGKILHLLQRFQLRPNDLSSPVVTRIRALVLRIEWLLDEKQLPTDQAVLYYFCIARVCKKIGMMAECTKYWLKFYQLIIRYTYFESMFIHDLVNVSCCII